MIWGGSISQAEEWYEMMHY